MPPRRIREAKVGAYQLILAEERGGLVGAIVRDRQVQRIDGDGLTADALWMRLHDELAKLTPTYIGYAGAMRRFRSFFPDGMTSSGFVQREGEYKRKASALLKDGAPLSEAGSHTGFGPAVARAFEATNLLDRHREKDPVVTFLSGPKADEFVMASAAFANGDLNRSLIELERILRPEGLAKWTVVTYLPFLWRPETHMYLKPEATCGFAERVGHQFAELYNSRLDPVVYRELLALAAETKLSIAALEPADNIDVQSFIWTVEKYQPGDGPKS